MDNFITWSMLFEWASFVSIVLMLTQFTKDIKYIKNVPTKYWSFFIALFLMIISNFEANSFKIIDIVLYVISSALASMNANGIYDFTSQKNKGGD